MEDRWLSMDEICQYLGVSDDTIHAWILKKNMPATKLGHIWRFKRERVDAWTDEMDAARAEKQAKKCRKK